MKHLYLLILLTSSLEAMEKVFGYTLPSLVSESSIPTSFSETILGVENNHLDSSSLVFNKDTDEAVKKFITKGKDAYKNGYCPGNLLIFGAPGNGKTMLARALVKEMNIPYIFIKCNEYNHLTKAEREAKAQAVLFFVQTFTQPLVIVLDEVDTYPLLFSYLYPSTNTGEKSIIAITAKKVVMKKTKEQLNDKSVIEELYIKFRQVTRLTLLPIEYPDKESREKLLLMSLGKSGLLKSKELDDAIAAGVAALDGYSSQDIKHFIRKLELTGSITISVLNQELTKIQDFNLDKDH